jgi:hypothetical protein
MTRAGFRHGVPPRARVCSILATSRRSGSRATVSTVSNPLPLAEAAVRLRGKPGRPRLSEEAKAERAAHRQAARAAALAAVAPRLFDVPGAARYLGISTWTVRDLVAAGRIPRIVIPGADGGDLRALRLDREDLDRLIATWKNA